MNFEFAAEPVVAGLIASVRVGVMLISGPFFGHLAMPTGLRIAFAASIGWLIAPGFAAGSDWTAWDAQQFGAAIVLEAGVGLLLGFGSRLIFSGFELLGEFISTQGGLGAARFLDPGSGTPSVALARALRTFSLMVFVAIDGHHHFLRAVAESFDAFPVGGAALDIEAFAAVAHLASAVFLVALRLSAPLSVTIFIQNVGMGVMARAMPQLNLMMVQLPAHIAVLLLIVGLGAGELVHSMKDVVEMWPDQVARALLGNG